MKRTRRIIVILSEEEYLLVKEAAVKNIATVSAYIRKAIVDAARKGEGR